VSLNYFQLFELPETFALTLSALETPYRRIQASAHPDRYVTATPTEQRQSMQLATLANEAYLTLKNPAKRAEYLLNLKGIDSLNDSNTSMPADFLMQQMEWREALEDASMAKDTAGLESLFDEMQAEANRLTTLLTTSNGIITNLRTRPIRCTAPTQVGDRHRFRHHQFLGGDG
jgi:molecular chaperone HscB